jgi:hypothetical protein
MFSPTAAISAVVRFGYRDEENKRYIIKHLKEKGINTGICAVVGVPERLVWELNVGLQVF